MGNRLRLDLQTCLLMQSVWRFILQSDTFYSVCVSVCVYCTYIFNKQYIFFLIGNHLKSLFVHLFVCASICVCLSVCTCDYACVFARVSRACVPVQIYQQVRVCRPGCSSSLFGRWWSRRLDGERRPVINRWNRTRCQTHR